LESKELPPYALREVNKCELLKGEKIVLSALVDDPDEPVPRSARIGNDAIDLPESE
jgi:hypothetical protein